MGRWALKDGDPTFMGAPCPGHDGEGGGAGSKGDKGDPGKDGEDGLPGADGKDGKDGQPGADGLPGADGQDGEDGLPGADGKDGADAGDSPHDHDDLTINMPSDHKWPGPGTVFVSGPPTDLSNGMVGGIGRGSKKVTSIISNGYPSSDGQWKSLGAQSIGGNPAVGATQLDLHPLGAFYVRVAEQYPTGSAHAGPPVQFTVTESGPTFRAMPSKTRTVEDVLERAETAEFPPEDDEGVTTMDDHDEVPLFEVVSALLAKVKQQSEQIADLSERIATVEA